MENYFRKEKFNEDELEFNIEKRRKFLKMYTAIAKDERLSLICMPADESSQSERYIKTSLLVVIADNKEIVLGYRLDIVVPNAGLHWTIDITQEDCEKIDLGIEKYYFLEKIINDRHKVYLKPTGRPIILKSEFEINYDCRVPQADSFDEDLKTALTVCIISYMKFIEHYYNSNKKNNWFFKE